MNTFIDLHCKKMGYEWAGKELVEVLELNSIIEIFSASAKYQAEHIAERRHKYLNSLKRS